MYVHLRARRRREALKFRHHRRPSNPIFFFSWLFPHLKCYRCYYYHSKSIEVVNTGRKFIMEDVYLVFVTMRTYCERKFNERQPLFAS
jgi:hypothetical protein